jgi:SAM-dependent methyltransferase
MNASADMDIGLPRVAQRGRALINFQAGLALAAGTMRRLAERELADQGITAETLPQSMDAIHETIETALAGSDAYRIYHFLAEWRAREHGPACYEAFEEIADEVVPALRALEEGPATLQENPGLELPKWYSEVWFHRTAGGWDASEFNGYVHGELIHKQLLTKIFPDGIFAQRLAVACALPETSYRRILDMGASSGHYTLALARSHPQAQITGVDYSLRMLQHARRVANANGYSWRLKVAGAECTGLDDESFDLVTSFIVLHELPPRIIVDVFAEAFRLLAPGGDMVMADVPRYADIDRMAQWRYDIVAKWGGEPYWRASASADLQQLAKDAGFTGVRAAGLGLAPHGHPYVLYARKPARAGVH